MVLSAVQSKLLVLTEGLISVCIIYRATRAAWLYGMNDPCKQLQLQLRWSGRDGEREEIRGHAHKSHQTDIVVKKKGEGRRDPCFYGQSLLPFLFSFPLLNSSRRCTGLCRI